MDHAPAPAVHAVPAPGVEYIAPAPAVPDVPSPVVEYIAPAMRGLAPVVDYIAPTPAVKRPSSVVAPVVEYIAPSPAVSRPYPVVEYIAPAPAVQRLAPVGKNTVPTPALVAEYVEPAPVCRPTPVVEDTAPVPTLTPAISSSPALSGQSRQSAHRDSTEVPTVSSRHHDELLRAERVLRARAARQGYLFRQMKRRDTQLAAQLTSLGKACDVARGSPAMSLLVSVATREQGLSAKLLAVDKQVEDHEVTVLELERQVQVLEEEKEKMWRRMVQVEERLSEDVLCLSVGVSQTGAALRTVEHKLWDWDEVARLCPRRGYGRGLRASSGAVCTRQESAEVEPGFLCRVRCVPRPRHKPGAVGRRACCELVMGAPPARGGIKKKPAH